MENHIYVRSLCLMLYRSIVTVLPGVRLRIEHSISRGYYCRLLDAEGLPLEATQQAIDDIRTEMRRLHHAALPFGSASLHRDEAIALFEQQHLPDKVALLNTVSDPVVEIVTLDGIADTFDGPVADNTSQIGVFDLRPYKAGFLLLPPDPANPSVAARPLRQAKMYDAFLRHQRFNEIIGISNVADLNRAVEQDRTGDLINVAEALHFKSLSSIADDIARRHREGGARIVMMAGPSSSGKTTTGKRLAIQLMTNLMRPKMISLDDYFVDRHHTPLDENGDYDFEHLHALDLDLFGRHLQALLRGETINLPTYSFEHGARIERDRPLSLGPNDVLLIEGIHGLNPELTASVPADQIFKVYISALTTLHIDDHNWISTSDTRLLRRIVRDHKYRHTSPADTIHRWPSVRRGEERWIFPYQENADAMFNSSLIFELGVMKAYAEPLLHEVPDSDPAVYETAQRMIRFLHWFRPVPADQIPSTSLLREFLGGSSFHY